MSNLLITLCVGLIIGYAAQRSRFCLIGGVRDYMIVKDKYLLKGMFALLITAALLFLALHLLGVHQENMKNYPMFIKDTTDQQVIEASACANTKPLYLFLKKAGGLKFNRWGAKLDLSGYCTIAGAFIIGILSVLAGGCPLRQHVKAAGGNKSAIVYLGGFYVGVIVYMLFLNDLIEELVGELNDEPADPENEDPHIEKIDDTSWRVIGNVELCDLEEETGVELASDDYDTLTGLVFDKLGMIPVDGPQNITIELDKLTVHIDKIESHQIDSAVITLKPSEEMDENEE